MRFANAPVRSRTTESVRNSARRGGACRGVRLLRRWWSWVAGDGRRRAAFDSADPLPLGRPAGPWPETRPTAALLAERRAEAMRRLFPMLSSWRAPPSYTDRLAAAYAQVSQAADLAELDRRVRQIEQTQCRTGAPRFDALILN